MFLFHPCLQTLICPLWFNTLLGGVESWRGEALKRLLLKSEIWCHTVSMLHTETPRQATEGDGPQTASDFHWERWSNMPPTYICHVCGYECTCKFPKGCSNPRFTQKNRERTWHQSIHYSCEQQRQFIELALVFTQQSLSVNVSTNLWYIYILYVL